MDEYTRRVYHSEDDFLADWFMLAEALTPLCGWQPDYRGADPHERDCLCRAGKLTELAFDGASIAHGREGWSSLNVYLRSSTRYVVVRVSQEGIHVMNDSARQPRKSV